MTRGVILITRCSGSELLLPGSLRHIGLIHVIQATLIKPGNAVGLSPGRMRDGDARREGEGRGGAVAVADERRRPRCEFAPPREDGRRPRLLSRGLSNVRRYPCV